ncbi:MAG TPA: hypothetical protein VGC99_23000 [Candidatus Tectomicrobia bacterium]
MRAGQRLGPAPTLDQIRQHAAAELARLPEHLRQLQVAPPLSGGHRPGPPRPGRRGGSADVAPTCVLGCVWRPGISPCCHSVGHSDIRAANASGG